MDDPAKKPKQKPSRRDIELRDTGSECGTILRLQNWGIEVNVRNNALKPVHAFPDSWSYAMLNFHHLPELAVFINGLVERYNLLVDRMNEEADKSVPLKKVNKLAS